MIKFKWNIYLCHQDFLTYVETTKNLQYSILMMLASSILNTHDVSIQMVYLWNCSNPGQSYHTSKSIWSNASQVLPPSCQLICWIGYNQSINQPINQSVNQTIINQSINHTINESINQYGDLVVICALWWHWGLRKGLPTRNFMIILFQLYPVIIMS